MATHVIDNEQVLDLKDMSGFNPGDTIVVRGGSHLTVTCPTAEAGGEIADIIAYSKLTIDGSGYKRLVVSGASGTLNVGDTITVKRSNDTIGTCIYHKDISGDLGVRLLTFPVQSGDALSTTGGWSATAAADATVEPMELLINEIKTGAETELTLRAGWYDLGVGDNTPGQTFTYFSTARCPAIRIGPGTEDGWVYYINIDSEPFTDFSTGELGRVFQQPFGSATITMGDGVNGNTIPIGYKVQCQSAIFTDHEAGAPADTTVEYDFTGLKQFILENVAFAQPVAFTYIGSIGDQSIIKGCAFGRDNRTDNVSVDLTFHDCAFAKKSGENANILSFSSIGGVILLNCTVIVSGQQGQPFTGIKYFEARGCTLIAGPGTNVTAENVLPSTPGQILIEDSLLVGRLDENPSTDNGDVKLINCRWARTTLPGATAAVSNQQALDTKSRAIVDNYQMVPGSQPDIGANARTLDFGLGTSRQSIITNCGQMGAALNQGLGHRYAIYSVDRDVFLHNCHFDMSGNATNVYVVLAQGARAFQMYNCSMGSDNRFYVQSPNVDLRSYIGIPNTVGDSNSDFFFLASSVLKNSIFATTFPYADTTVGMIRLFANPASQDNAAYEIKAGSPEFRLGTFLYLKQGDKVCWTLPYNALGFTGFGGEPILRSSGLSVGGLDTKCVWTYDIASGGGFSGEMKPFTYANLLLENVDWETGPQMRIEVECTDPGGAQFQQLGIPMQTNATARLAMYPSPAITAPVWRTLEWVVSSRSGGAEHTGTIRRDEGPNRYLVTIQDVQPLEDVDEVFLVVQPESQNVPEYPLTMRKVEGGGNQYEYIASINEFDQYPPGETLRMQVELKYRSIRMRGRCWPYAKFSIGSTMRDDEVTAAGLT